MVNSKKMSKSSIAVIVLAILLVLSMVMGITGAWFTATSNDDATGSGTLTMGSIGTFKITADNAVFTRGDSTKRTYVMPGDTVTCGSVSLSYAQATAGDESVWYIVSDGTEYYVFDKDTSAAGAQTGAVLQKLTGETPAAKQIAIGASVTTKAQYATVADSASTTVAVDGTGSAIPNYSQEKGLNIVSVGFSANGATYTVYGLQTSNFTTGTEAYTQILALISAESGYPAGN